MEPLRLNSSTFLPDATIEGYTSFIWTERFQAPGEFVLKTPLVDETRALLPQHSLISHRDTREVMFVLTHSIGVDDNGVRELTIVGEGFPIILNDRVVTGFSGTSYQPFFPTTASWAISGFLWNMLVNTSGEDMFRSYAGGKDAKDAIPNVAITNSVENPSGTEYSYDWVFSPGPAFPIVQDWLARGGVGLRTMRPQKNSSMHLVSITNPSKNIIRTLTLDFPQLVLDQYQGKDRTVANLNGDGKVVFSYDAGAIDDPSYIFSVKDYKIIAHVTSDVEEVMIWGDGFSPWYTGFDRRVLWVDGGSRGSKDPALFTKELTQKGQTELAKHNRKILFDGSITDTANYEYKLHYYLGDLVVLAAEYGIKQTMQVVEYIQIEDQEGDRGYPTLGLPV